jgi:hypothetical protein
LTADEIASLFTRADGSYLFARWTRPVVPVVFGLDDATLATVKGAIEALVAVAGHRMAGTDPEQGANLLIFFCRGWTELLEVPDLGRLVEGLDRAVARLTAEGADRYAQVHFEADGAIRASFVLVNMGGRLAAEPADRLALDLALRALLLRSDQAFADRATLVEVPEGAIVRPELLALLAAAYDPVLPPVARDRSHALRLAARVGG